MVRVLLGIIKGGLVGAAIGFAATKVGLGGGFSAWLVYGIIGALVGIVCGKAIWRQDTLVTPLLKGIVGFGVGAGLYWIASKTLGGFKLPVAMANQFGASDARISSVPLLLGPVIGILYGLFVEVDDGERKGGAAGSPPSLPKAGAPKA